MSREVVLAVEEFSGEDLQDAKAKKTVPSTKPACEPKNAKNGADSRAISAGTDFYESGNSMPFDDDDIPSDFFDDFSNQDFMAGLDVVDAWDDEDMLTDKEKAKKLEEVRLLQKRKRQRTERLKRKCSRSPVRPGRYNLTARRSRPSRDRDHLSRDQERTSRDHRRRSKELKSKEKSKEAKEGKEGEPDERRDPEKTKRDIQKDKDKCAKDKEAKIINEKLKVVETGLVPPGTEMEVDLKQLKTAIVAASEPEAKLPAIREDRRRRSRSKSIGDTHNNRYAYRDKRGSPPRRTSRSQDRNFGRRAPYRRSRSPYRPRSRSRSPYRRRMSTERRLYIEERRRTRRFRDSSPTVLRKKSRERPLDLSPVSNVSERELWLRQREYKRSRKLSCSPISDTESINRKRSHDFLEELANKLNSDKKKQFYLKEIQDRLNEPSHSHSQVKSGYGHQPGPVPPPASVMHGPQGAYMPGPPQYFSRSLEPTPQYDQQFFIGQPTIFHSNPNPYGPQYLGPTPIPNNQTLISTNSNSIVVQPSLESPLNYPPAFASVPKNNVDILKAQKVAEAQKEKDQEAITKLFEDKKISLSDFLSMSAKPAGSTRPINVQKKVKVIALCQDAVKALGGDSKLGGRFFLRKPSQEVDKKEDAKHASPLRKIPVIRFAFTVPAKHSNDKSNTQLTLGKLLASLGLTETSASTPSKPPPSPTIAETSIASKENPSPKEQTTPTKPPRKLKYDPILGAKFQMKMCQTDPVKCNICEIRKARKFVDRGTQCVSGNQSRDFGTQMSEEDAARMGFKTPVKDALKNQSLAHLTAAQILAAQGGGLEDSPKKDLFPAAPPPPDISPDKYSARNNDNFSGPNRAAFGDRFKPHNNIGRSGNFQMFDKLVASRSFDNGNRSNSFDRVSPVRLNFENRSNVNDRFRGNANFNQRPMDDELEFEPLPQDDYGGTSNQRLLSHTIRGNFKPRPYRGGRKFF